jgi:hypothetical protein
MKWGFAALSPGYDAAVMSGMLHSHDRAPHSVVAGMEAGSGADGRVISRVLLRNVK